MTVQNKGRASSVHSDSGANCFFANVARDVGAGGYVCAIAQRCCRLCMGPERAIQPRFMTPPRHFFCITRSIKQRTCHGAPELFETRLRCFSRSRRVHCRCTGRAAGAAGAGEWQHAISQSGRLSRRHHQRGGSPDQARGGALGAHALASSSLGLAPPSPGLASPSLEVAPSLAPSPLASLVAPAPELKKGSRLRSPSGLSLSMNYATPRDQSGRQRPAYQRKP